MSKAADATGGKRPTRIVIDANTLISAVLGSKKKPPADIHALVDGALSDPTVAVIICPHLLDETENAFSRPKLARLVRADEIPDIMRRIPWGAMLVADPRASFGSAETRRTTTSWRWRRNSEQRSCPETETWPPSRRPPPSRSWLHASTWT